MAVFRAESVLWQPKRRLSDRRFVIIIVDETFLTPLSHGTMLATILAIKWFAKLIASESLSR